MRQNPNLTTYSDKASPEQISNPGEIQFFDPETGISGTLEEIERRSRQQKVSRKVLTTGFSQKHGERELPEGLSFSA